MPWASERVELFNPSVPRQPARRAVMGSMRDTRWQTLLPEIFRLTDDDTGLRDRRYGLRL